MNNNFKLTDMDASYILQHAVSLITLPFNGRSNIWVFNPTSGHCSPLDSDRTGQNFGGIIIGDGSGNYGTVSTNANSGDKASLVIGSATVQAGAEVSVPIILTPMDSDVLALAMLITYDNALLEMCDVRVGTSVTNALVASNTATSGTATITVALPEKLATNGER